jgi:hypothetical protein
MSKESFDFLGYCDSLEKVMLAWHDHSRQTFKHSGNLGSAREYFIGEILNRFLPGSVVVGSGEIIDGKERSGQQDIIIYRSDFPVLAGFDSVNTYLIEGVIATIEVKSDLTTGSPNGLTSAFKSAASVLSLTNQAVKLFGTDQEFQKLQAIYSTKTFVIGYKGWSTKESFLENYRVAANEVEWKVPDLVYQPSGCIIRASNITNLRDSRTNKTVGQEVVPLAYAEDHTFAIFFQHLLRAVMSARVVTATAPGVNAAMMYGLDNYFSLPNITATPIQLLRNSNSPKNG